MPGAKGTVGSGECAQKIPRWRIVGACQSERQERPHLFDNLKPSTPPLRVADPDDFLHDVFRFVSPNSARNPLHFAHSEELRTRGQILLAVHQRPR